MNTFQRSWELFKTSLRVMQRDKQLLLFPVITTVCTMAITLLFLVPVAFQPTGRNYTSADHWNAVGQRIYKSNDNQPITVEKDGTGVQTQTYRSQRQGLQPLAVGYFAFLYFVSMFTATFFNVAFYNEILNALQGEAVSISDGLRFACTKWKTILMWTVFAGAVGYTIKALEQRFGWVGQLVMKLVGTAWSIACVFVIPVIITEETTSNPFQVLKKSALTLKQTWGESLVGYAGVSFGGLIVLFASLLWLGGTIATSIALHLYWLIAVAVVVWVFALIAWSYLMSVASQIFRCALFVYASGGALPAPYTPEMMELAWKKRK